jgi:signal transduction histidine kinase
MPPDLSDAILNVARSAIFVLDPQARVIRWNEAMTALTDVSAHAVLGEAFPDKLLFPEDVEVWKRDFIRIVAGSSRLRNTCRWRVRDSSGNSFATYPTCLSAVVRDAGGVASCIVFSVVEDSADLAGEFMKERERAQLDLSRFLHEGISQDLVVLSFSASEPQRTVIDRCCRDIRVISYILSGPSLSGVSLVEAIEEYAENMHEAGIEIAIESEPGLAEVSPEAEVLFFGAVQEWAARMAAKRMRARLFVGLRNGDSGVALELRSVPAATLEGWPTLRERARALGGRFEVTAGRDEILAVARMTLPEARPK